MLKSETYSELEHEFAIPLDEVSIYNTNNRTYIVSDYGVGIMFNVDKRKRNFKPDEEKETLFALAIERGDDAKHLVYLHNMNPNISIRSLEQVYNSSFDNTFKSWVKRMLHYCGKDALCYLYTDKITSNIERADIIKYNKQGELLFYGEYYR